VGNLDADLGGYFLYIVLVFSILTVIEVSNLEAYIFLDNGIEISQQFRSIYRSTLGYFYKKNDGCL
jgi:hypothetical protein